VRCWLRSIEQVYRPTLSSLCFPSLLSMQLNSSQRTSPASMEDQPRHPYESHELPLLDQQVLVVSAAPRRIQAKALLWQRLSPMMVASLVTALSFVPKLAPSLIGQDVHGRLALVFSGAQPYRSSVQVVTAPSLCFSFDVRSLLGISIMANAYLPGEKARTSLKSVSRIRFASREGPWILSCRTAKTCMGTTERSHFGLHDNLVLFIIFGMVIIRCQFIHPKKPITARLM
jgi:hypothetical protein